MTMFEEVELDSELRDRFLVELEVTGAPRGMPLRLELPSPTTLCARIPCHAVIAPATKTVPLLDAVSAARVPETKGASIPSLSAQSPFEGIQMANPETSTGED